MAKRGRRVAWALGTVFVVIGGLVAAGIVVSRSDEADGASDGASDGDGAEEVAVGESVAVERRDLARREEFDGVVGRGNESTITLAADGTLTGLPASGDVIEAGDEVAEVDGRPVMALGGGRPAWRALGPGVSDGDDVLQLEYSLVSLGYADADDITVDREWTSATTAAVKRFQAWVGLDDDGRLDLGEIVFLLGPVRVAGVEGEVGGQAAGTKIAVTGSEQLVNTSVPVEDADLLAVGTSVEIELADGTVLSGEVAMVGAPEVAEDGSVTLPVEVAVAGLDALDGMPVEVSVSEVEVAGALTVPVEALLALAEGGYAVEVPDAASATGRRLVAVEVGMFSDGVVEVTGDLTPGDQVLVP